MQKKKFSILSDSVKDPLVSKVNITAYENHLFIKKLLVVIKEKCNHLAITHIEKQKYLKDVNEKLTNMYYIF